VALGINTVAPFLQLGWVERAFEVCPSKLKSMSMSNIMICGVSERDVVDRSLAVATKDSDRSFAESGLHLSLIKMQKVHLGTQPMPCCARNSHSKLPC
jgi:hypothetical protein